MKPDCARDRYPVSSKLDANLTGDLLLSVSTELI